MGNFVASLREFSSVKWLSLAIIALLLVGLSSCGGSPQKHLDKGADLLEQGRWTDAIQQFEEATRLQPDLAQAYYMIGVAVNDAHVNCQNQFYSASWRHKGLEAVGRATELEPNNGDYYYARGLLYYYDGLHSDDAEKALADFDRAIGLGAQPARAHYRKAQIHRNFSSLETWQPGLAREEINLAIKLDPERAVFYEERAVIANVSATWLELGLRRAYPQQTFLGVINDLKKAIDLEPDEPRYYRYLAAVLNNHSEHHLSIVYYNLYIDMLKTQLDENISRKGSHDLSCRETDVRDSLIDGYERRADVREQLGDKGRAYEDRLAACELQDFPISDCLRPR